VLCIIKGHVPLISETFIDSHIQRLQGEKVVLYNYFPEYVCGGRTIRNAFTARPIRRKLLRLLPAFLYDRFVTRHLQHPETIRDFLHAFFRQQNVSCVLAEYGMNGADICPVARELGIPLVVHFHGHDAHRTPDLLPYLTKYQDAELGGWHLRGGWHLAGGWHPAGDPPAPGVGQAARL
jgi:hypothetical protein